MNYQPPTTIVTGSAGFIGFHVSKKLLEKGEKVIGIDNLDPYYDVSLKKSRLAILKKFPNFVFHKTDITKPQQLSKVFSSLTTNYRLPPTSYRLCHLAAQVGVRNSLTNPLKYINTNILGFFNILECCRMFGIKNIVYASSSSVYGSTLTTNYQLPTTDYQLPTTSYQLPTTNYKLSTSNIFTESFITDMPLSVYGMTKKADELLAYSYHHLYGLNLTGLRFFTVYGPWGRPDMAYFSFANAIVSNGTIQQYSGNVKRDFTYIDDIADGILRAAAKALPFAVINLGNNRPESVAQLISLLEKNLGKKARVIKKPLPPTDMLQTHADIAKAKQLLGWKPTTALEQGIASFCKWFKEYYKPRRFAK